MRIKALFIGNSFTERNDVPGSIAAIASAGGNALEHALISAGGASLRMHWNRGEAQSAIAASNWDYVVLQEQSTLPIKNSKRMHENIRLFDEAIRGAGARTALYLTWARLHEPQVQAVLTEAYQSIGLEIGALVVPVGIAWERVRTEHGSIVLHDADGSHPNRAGSYLAACVFAASLFGIDPRSDGTPALGVATGDAACIQRIAWETVTSST